MGLFDIFKKPKQPGSASTDNGVLGPTFFDGLTEHIEDPEKLHPHEWRRKLKSHSGQTKFRIKYYGRLHEDYPNLIIRTDFAPSLIIAVDIATAQEFLLFDGCKHGYDALFCDTYTNEEIKNRPATTFFKDGEGNDTFEITISTYYGFDYDEEFGDQVDENGLIELQDGTKMEFEQAKRNGFDTLQILATSENGKTIEIVSEELA